MTADQRAGTALLPAASVGLAHGVLAPSLSLMF